ncbi:MAG: hypothetical protein AAF901_13060, partial [Bacteroidota bacterium]
GQCGGNPIGRGSSISVNPLTAKDYYVRAEGGINTTNCTRKKIEVFERSLAPSSVFITGNKSVVCEGESIRLTVSGGQLAPDASWKWYENSCQGRYVGEGTNITVSPSQTSTYYVRGEGACNNTACASISIMVNQLSRRPTSIQANPPNSFRGDPVTLSIVGGSLGSSARWEWGKGDCKSNNTFETGNRITVRPRVPTTYYVRANGQCNITDCASIRLNPLKISKVSQHYDGKQLIHLGFGIGADYFQISTPATFSDGSSQNYTDTATLRGLGLSAELFAYPIFTDILSIGVIGGLNIGIHPSQLDYQNPGDEKYTYTRLDLGGEVALGIAPIKLLAKYKRQLFTNDYQKTPSSGPNISLNRDLYHERLEMGLRMGRYKPRSPGKARNTFDVTLIYGRNSYDKISLFQLSSTGFETWNRGFGLSLWQPNKLKFDFTMIYPAEGQNFRLSNLQSEDAFFNIRVTYNINRFFKI